MNTYDIINELRAQGAILKRNCDELRVFCREGLITEAQAEYIREHKGEILGIIDKEKKLTCLPIADPLPSYLETLEARIQALEAEYSSLLKKQFTEGQEKRSRYLMAMITKHRQELAELDQAEPDLPTEITVTLGAWSRRILKRDSVKVNPARIIDMLNSQTTHTTAPTPAPPKEFDRETQHLIEWFQSHEGALPRIPFTLRPCVKVEAPEKFYTGLHRDISMGPGYLKAQIGSLKRDLQDLKRIVELLKKAA